MRETELPPPLTSRQPSCHGYWPLDERSFWWAWSTIAICQAQGITKIRVSIHCAEPQTPCQLTSLANPFEPDRRTFIRHEKGCCWDIPGGEAIRLANDTSTARDRGGTFSEQTTFAAETLRVLLLPPSQHPQGYQPELGDFRRRSKDHPGVGVKNIGARRSV